MSDKQFVDTNVLVYAHDVDAGRRHAVATRLVAELWETRRAALKGAFHDPLLVANFARILGVPPEESRVQPG